MRMRGKGKKEEGTRAREMLYFCTNVKKSFLLKVSSVDSQKNDY